MKKFLSITCVCMVLLLLLALPTAALAAEFSSDPEQRAFTRNPTIVFDNDLKINGISVIKPASPGTTSAMHCGNGLYVMAAGIPLFPNTKLGGSAYFPGVNNGGHIITTQSDLMNALNAQSFPNNNSQIREGALYISGAGAPARGGAELGPYRWIMTEIPDNPLRNGCFGAWDWVRPSIVPGEDVTFARIPTGSVTLESGPNTRTIFLLGIEKSQENWTIGSFTGSQYANVNFNPSNFNQYKGVKSPAGNRPNTSSDSGGGTPGETPHESPFNPNDGD